MTTSISSPISFPAASRERSELMGFLQAGDVDQFFSHSDSTSLLRPGSPAFFDRELAGALILSVDAPRLEQARLMILSAFEADPAAQRDAIAGVRPFFGSLLAHCALRSAQAANAGESAAARLWLDKAILLASSPASIAGALPIAGALSIADLADSDFFGIPMSDPRVSLGSSEPLAAAARDCARRSFERSTHPFAAALFLAQMGEPSLIQALCSRPQRAQESDYFFAPKSSAAPFSGELLYSILKIPGFWKSSPLAAASLFKAAASSCSAQPISRNPFLPHMLASCDGHSSGAGFQAAYAMLGDQIFSRGPLESGAEAAFTLHHALRFAAVSGPWLQPALDNLFESLAGPAPGILRFDNGAYRPFAWSFLEGALFSPAPGAVKSLLAVIAKNAPEANPYAELFLAKYAPCSANGFAAFLTLACDSRSPDIMRKALDAAGPAPWAAFQGPKPGLAASASMFIAHNAHDAATFASALSWLDANGLLDEEADRRAWVCSSHNSRKKGDLLSQCVALGKVDFAQAFLALRPKWDIKPAKAVAKAMEHRSFKDRGVVAMIAWENIFLQQALGASLPQTPAPARRPRSL